MFLLREWERSFTESWVNTDSEVDALKVVKEKQKWILLLHRENIPKYEEKKVEKSTTVIQLCCNERV